MKKLAPSVAAFSALLATAASAADIRMPVKAPPPAPVAVYSWTGCYVGAGGGYGMFNQETTHIFGGPPVVALDNGGRGWFGTVQVGCDYQVGSNIVIGAFGDYDFSGIKGNFLPSTFQFGSVGEEKLRNAWAAGGRIGWLPLQQLLVFVSGGYTQARFGQVDFVGQVTGLPTGVSLHKHTYAGYFIGAGYEYNLGWFPGLAWKTEYRFADYGKENVPLILTAGGAPIGQSLDIHKYVQTVRSELVWRFNAGGGPLSAYAADLRAPMPVKAPAPVTAAYNWTGCYIGAGGGYGMFDQEVTFAPNGVPVGLHNDVGGRGWFGTVQGGCDYQIGSNIAIGAFGDWDFGNINGNWTNAIGAINLTGEEKLKNSWAAGGRIGWAAFNQFLVYVSGGYSQARFGDINLVAQTSGAPTPLSVGKHTYSGWFLGSGYEYGLNWFPGLFWKTEYRFYDYGTERVQIFNTGAPVAGATFDHEKFVHTVRTELVWRFNFGGPVVARY